MLLSNHREKQSPKKWAAITCVLLSTDKISRPVIGISDDAVISWPVVWEEACIKSAPISAWYPIKPNKIPNKSLIKPLFINLLVCPLEGSITCNCSASSDY